jgi:hypothetical protein
MREVLPTMTDLSAFGGGVDRSDTEAADASESSATRTQSYPNGRCPDINQHATDLPPQCWLESSSMRPVRTVRPARAARPVRPVPNG